MHTIRSAARLAGSLASAALLLEVPVRAAFQTPFLSAQSAAMGGGASLSASGDSTALFLNPAGIAGLKASESYFSYSDMFAGLSGVGGIGAGFAAGAVPTRFGAFGLGLGMLNAAGLLQERTISLGYAASLGRGITLGVAGKDLYHSYMAASDPASAQNPVFQRGTARSAFSFDAGIIASLGRRLRLGISVRNINAPNVGLASEDRVAREVQAGAAVDVMGFNATADMPFLNTGLSSGRPLPNFGLEKQLYGERLALRVGGGGSGLSAGMGLKLARVGFDYAFVLNNNLVPHNMGSHSVGMRLQFGGSQ